MSKYFNYFPKALYTNDNESGVVVTNITARFAFEKSYRDNSAVYYEYDIQDSDTPEIIAYKMYGNSERHWIVLMMNEIVDPQYDWPLDQRTFVKYMNDKYSANASVGQTGIQWANANIHSYYIIETRTTDFNNANLEKRLEVDANTYANTIVSSSNITLKDGIEITVAVSKDIKTYYDYETDLNESKRTIKILRPEFITPLEKELKNAFAS
jgi:hypothetical protein